MNLLILSLYNLSNIKLIKITINHGNKASVDKDILWNIHRICYDTQQLILQFLVNKVANMLLQMI